MAGSLPPPNQNISPLIKSCRWVALTTGIIYGALRYNYLSKREIDIQKHENEIREKYRQKKAAEKMKLEAEEMATLGKEAGVLPRKQF